MLVKDFFKLAADADSRLFVYYSTKGELIPVSVSKSKKESQIRLELLERWQPAITLSELKKQLARADQDFKIVITRDKKIQQPLFGFQIINQRLILA